MHIFGQLIWRTEKKILNLLFHIVRPQNMINVLQLGSKLFVAKLTSFCIFSFPEQWIMDVLICNGLGVYLGMKTCEYLGNKVKLYSFIAGSNSFHRHSLCVRVEKKKQYI